MKNSICSFCFLILYIGLFSGLIIFHGELWQIAFLLILIAAGVYGEYTGYNKNVVAAFGSLLFGGATFWSAAEAINSIDFDKPFFLSFYWSTVGYVVLTLVLLIITAGALSETANEPDRL